MTVMTINSNHCIHIDSLHSLAPMMLYYNFVYCLSQAIQFEEIVKNCPFSKIYEILEGSCTWSTRNCPFLL